ncbi:claudin-22-like [Rana temporaria]|uniref:claudin-22-like n=1 Tax=Rana temporaria TaxID=8407 RepID=UPI001AACF3DA|nr:claudin-22-like [Rana temporaria]
MEAVVCITELAGLFLSLSGYVCCLVALFIPQWLTYSPGLLVSEYYQLGLWKTCFVQDVGLSVCQEYQTPLHLTPQIRMGRVLVCLSVFLGALGFIASVPTLTWVKCLDDTESNVKKTLALLGGILFAVSGALTFGSVSYFAYDTLVKFWDDNIPKDIPRWEFGDAMYAGWTGGFSILSGGIVLIFSQFRASQDSELK